MPSAIITRPEVPEHTHWLTSAAWLKGGAPCRACGHRIVAFAERPQAAFFASSLPVFAVPGGTGTCRPPSHGLSAGAHAPANIGCLAGGAPCRACQHTEKSWPSLKDPRPHFCTACSSSQCREGTGTCHPPSLHDLRCWSTHTG